MSVRQLVVASYARMRRDEVEPSPFDGEVERRNHTWALRLGLIDYKSSSRLARIGCGSFAAHTYPAAPIEVVELGANLITWLFLFDDAYGEGGADVEESAMRARFDSLERLLRDGTMPPAPGPFTRALADLRARLLARATDAWMQRFADSMARYFDGCLLELPYRRERRLPTRSEYRALRRWSVGGLPVFDLVELTLPAPLPDASARELAELRGRAAELCAWVNDIFSFDKEAGDDDPLNLVAVLMGEGKLSMRRAFDAAASVYNDDLAAFTALHDRFVARADTSADERAYARGLAAWVHGNHAWTQTSQRYAELDRMLADGDKR